VRSAFLSTLLDVAVVDPRVELIVGDLGFGVIEPFRDRFEDRFLNVGVAEQNMTGIATGLALTGSVVFTYSIANFATMRCLEQLRNDACYHDANVKVVAVGGGLAYGNLGISHHATEDLAMLRVMPRLRVAAPGDPAEASAITRIAAATDGPFYLRLGKANETAIHAEVPALEPGTSVPVLDGDDVAILVTGALLPTGVRAGELLQSSGISARVISMPWIEPLDIDTVRTAGANYDLVVTLEEHSICGGLGGAVAEVLCEMPSRARQLRVGLPPTFTSIVGTQEHLRQRYGLDPESVASRIAAALKEHRSQWTPQ